MNKGGPIIIIEDDSDDQEILNSVFESLDCKNAGHILFRRRTSVKIFNRIRS
jgi:hypothetical protein